LAPIYISTKTNILLGCNDMSTTSCVLLVSVKMHII